MRVSRHAAVFVGAIALVMTSLLSGVAAAKSGSSDPNVRYDRAVLAAGATSGAVVSAGGVTLAASGLASGTYTDPHRPASVPYESGTWTGAWQSTGFAYDELVASWNAATPANTWIRIEMQGGGSERETKWYTLGIWASGDGDILRTSVSLQGDGDGFIAIDTFVRGKKALPLDAYRLRVTLYRRAGSGATPTLRAVSAMASGGVKKYAIPSATTRTERRVLAVPEYSQETHIGHFPEYDNGGEAWCSPTSTAMVLRFWGTGPDAAALAAFPGADHADGQVDHAARYVYDWNYDGAGNWPYNTAYATTYGLDGFVTRLRSLAEAERFIDAGIPLVASINGKLPGFLFGSTNGHLLVISGFEANGDVISNDPAVMTNDEVQKTYARADFESVWLEGSGGIVYVIRPSTKSLPANVPGLPNNW
jgi:hypothetical protein